MKDVSMSALGTTTIGVSNCHFERDIGEVGGTGERGGSKPLGAPKT